MSKWLRSDLLLHALASFAVSVMAFAVLFTAWHLRGWAVAAALGAAALVGFGKELYDKLHPDTHTAEWADIIADGVGALGALIVELAIILSI